MDWTMAHEHASWSVLQKWKAAGTEEHRRTCSAVTHPGSCRCRRRHYEHLMAKMFLPFIRHWTERTAIARARFSEDDFHLIQVDVAERLTLGDHRELAFMAALDEPVAPPVEVEDDEESAFALIGNDLEISAENACASWVTLRETPQLEPADASYSLTPTPIQRRIRALFRFALVRRLQGRLPSWARDPEGERRPPRRYRFTNAALHAGTRTLELAFQETQQTELDHSVALDDDRLIAAVKRALEAMPAPRREIYDRWLSGQKPSEIAREMHRKLQHVKAALNTAQVAVRRAVERAR